MRTANVLPTALIEPLEQRRLLSAGLTPAIVGRPPKALPPAGHNHLTVRLTNRDSATVSGAAEVQLFASTDAVLDGLDALLGSTARAVRLPRNRGINVRIDFDSPTTLHDGRYYLIAAADGGAVVGRSTVAIRQPFGDVAVAFASLPGRPIEIDGRSAGKSIAAVRVTNAGNVRSASAVGVQLYLSADAVLEGTDPLLAETPARVLSLRPGQSGTMKTRVAVPPSATAGGYFLFAVLKPAAAAADGLADNDVARSSRRVAVVDRLPVVPIYKSYYVSFYNGPDYYDYGDGYGFFSPVYVAPGYDTPAPPDGGGPTSGPAGGVTSMPDTQPTTQPVDQGPYDPPADDSGPAVDNSDDSGPSSDSDSSDGGDDSDIGDLSDDAVRVGRLARSNPVSNRF